MVKCWLDLRSSLVLAVIVVSIPELVWTTEENMKRGALDKIDQPGGLGWPGTMRLGTGSQLVGERRHDEVELYLELHAGC